MYAEEHGGQYPDSIVSQRTSNAVFRQLFVEDILDNEMIFGCPTGPFTPDGNVGSYSPARLEAVKPGENHWAMTAGLSTSAQGTIPLVFENPVTATWPPTWNADAKGSSTRGRAWSRGILIGVNDGSVEFHQLAENRGTSVPLKKSRDGKDLFELAIDPVKFPKGEILDVEVAPDQATVNR